MYLQFIYNIALSKLYKYIYYNCIYYIEINTDDIENKIERIIKENIQLKKELEYMKNNINIVLVDIDTI